MKRSPHLAKDIGHLLSLPLSPLVGAKFSLCHLKSTLVLTHLQKLSNPLFIRSKASNFPNQVLHKMHPFACFLQNQTKPNQTQPTRSEEPLNQITLESNKSTTKQEQKQKNKYDIPPFWQKDEEPTHVW